ncbi:MAG: GSCFA domain-containing protein [Bacteroidales bacterium]|nr:GSCFA domain-containing protein [Bacteroidales bacterium]
MKLQTPVADTSCRTGISYEDRIMMLGSCFADNVGRQLQDYGFSVCVNPFGTLYNPVSVMNSVERLVSGRPFTEDECVMMGSGSDRICSFSHHTSFSALSPEDFLTNANAALSEAAEFFRTCTKIVITLGTAWCFRHVRKNIIVSNCLKRDSSEFVRERLPVEEVTGVLKHIMDLCPEKEFIFTVSPIRHFKDGAHGNQISKSALLLGVDNLLAGEYGQRADYFPAYEIVMDELRDYRFYAEDMCHPTSQTVDYIRERFLSWALPGSEKKRLEDSIKLFKRSRHIERP